MGTGAATAGWIFADMLLVLMIVGLGAQITSTPAQEQIEPVVKQEDSPPVMRKKSVERTISVDTGALLSSGSARDKELKAVEAEVKKATRSLRGKRAAMVLVWGSSPEVGRGTRVAKIVGRQLPKTNKQLFADVVPRPLWKGGEEGRVVLELYVFS